MSEKACKDCGEIKPLDDFYSRVVTPKTKPSYRYYHPECKDCSKSRFKKWIQENPERFYEGQRRRDKNPPPSKIKLMRENSKRLREGGYYKKWQEENRDKTRAYSNFRQMNKLHEITKKEWKACKEYFNNSCAYCGLSEKEHKELYGQDLHKEHVDHNGSNGIDNCVPACRSCNSSKWQHPLIEWYWSDNEHFTEERFFKILDWLSKHSKNIAG